jgi:hypothetical protein
MVFWLILVASYGGQTMMHVGNFDSMKSCLAAAQASQTYAPVKVGGGATFYCVQANETNTKPPEEIKNSN